MNVKEHTHTYISMYVLMGLCSDNTSMLSISKYINKKLQLFR